MTQMTDGNNNTKTETLYIAMDLSKKTWVIAFGDGQKIRRQTVVARDFEGMKNAIKKAKYKLKLADKCKVVSCYEAGRDGFWIHRWLESIGVENKVVDAASIEKSSRKTLCVRIVVASVEKKYFRAGMVNEKWHRNILKSLKRVYLNA